MKATVLKKKAINLLTIKITKWGNIGSMDGWFDGLMDGWMDRSLH